MDTTSSAAAPPARRLDAAYGLSDFTKIRKQNRFYADKTEFAVKLLGYERAVLLRPPRCGKSMFISMLECLYDVRHVNDFDLLFGGLYAGEHRREEFNSFHVLVLTLPGMMPANVDEYKEEFKSRILSALCDFLLWHPNVLSKLSFPDILEFRREYKTDVYSGLRAVARVSEVLGHELMILVDEFDRAPMGAYAEEAEARAKASQQPRLSPTTGVHAPDAFSEDETSSSASSSSSSRKRKGETKTSSPVSDASAAPEKRQRLDEAGSSNSTSHPSTSGSATPRFDKAVSVLSEFYGQLKSLQSVRYYLTGIFSVPSMALSIFNEATHLTHDAEFAHVCGLTEADMRDGLEKVAGVTDTVELKRAVAFLKVAANGYNFFAATETLFNPQLIHQFLRDYRQHKYNQELPSALTDYNQVLSDHQLLIATHNPDLKQVLLKACADGSSFDQTLRHVVSARGSCSISPAMYLFQLGVLSLKSLNVTFKDGNSVKLRVPNVSMRKSYAQAFLATFSEADGTPDKFLTEPTPETLLDLLNSASGSGYVWTNEQTEADFQSFLAAQFIVGSSVTPGAERAPGGKSKRLNSAGSSSASASSTTTKVMRIDLILRTDRHVIVVELKTLRAFIRSTTASQSLLAADSDHVGLTTTRSGEAYPEAGLKALRDLSEFDFLALGCTYAHGQVKYATVAEVHTSAETQVKGYAQAEFDGRVSGSNLSVLAFAVTQVVNRFHVTQVQW